ncbi:leptin receptor isoform X1 [Oryzias melastigma]|uniref:Leptin receptor n=2 Tax=Oryzias melastigma TaxID=30732 RepID=A0A3B3D7S3_ORYME|nr:leptin receptor isoform X1 [Oryzias melastigma]
MWRINHSSTSVLFKRSQIGFRGVMLAVLIHIFLMPHAAQCLKPGDGAAILSGALGLPWHDELCCDSPSASLSGDRGVTNRPTTNGTMSSLPHHPRCKFRRLKPEFLPQKPSDGICLDILCRINENWENVTCYLQLLDEPSGKLDAGGTTFSFQQLTDKDATEVNSNPVVCEAEESFTCSLPLHPEASYVATVTVNVSSVMAPPVFLIIPARPVKPSPPVNVTHYQTIEPELIVQWESPPHFNATQLRYEVRYSTKNDFAWQVVSVTGEPRLSLDLQPDQEYTVQVRCSSLDEPPLWSEWSAPYKFYLYIVTYIPEKMVAQAGKNVTVYCVFNNRSMNASEAVWKLNFHQPLPSSMYHPVSERVSKITMRASESRMYDLLTCTPEAAIPYSQISIEGASLDIRCEINGDMDTMECSWNSTQWLSFNLQHKWTHMSCNSMKQKEEAGENVGKIKEACFSIKPRTCTFHPLHVGCYKLWLELGSDSGSVRSKPIYLSSKGNVKPYSPSNVKALTLKSGVLSVRWEPPSLPADGLQYELQYHILSTVKEDWKILGTKQPPPMTVEVPEMCRVYVVQVRCKHIGENSYWSEWSDIIYSTPNNSRAPEQGPDFWRIRQDDHHKNKSNVTLLFEHFPVTWNSYCVDGFIVQHLASNGSVVRKHINLGPSYSFEWNQEPQTVTVEAYNSLGNSTHNMKMTLEKTPRRKSLHSVHALVLNSTHASLSWSLLDDSVVPLFMVVQWSESSGLSGLKWVRLPYSNQAVYINGNFSHSEDYGFHLYPVFADMEGEPMYIIAAKKNPAAYMIMMSISFLCIVLLFTLVLTQNQIKKNLVWKHVPNPKKCSWAKGLDFRKMDTFDLFQPAEGLQTCPLLPSDNIISKVIIVEKTETKAFMESQLMSLSCDPVTSTSSCFAPAFDRSRLDTSAPSSQSPDKPNQADPEASDIVDSSASTSVRYAKLLLPYLKQEKQSGNINDGSNSSDEGNFSANNSEMSESSPTGLWELESCHSAETDDQRRSCSYASEGELSEMSEHESVTEQRQEQPLCYLQIGYPAEDEESEEEEQREEEEEEKRKEETANLNGKDFFVPLICDLSSQYMPQYRTAAYRSQLLHQTEELQL